MKILKIFTKNWIELLVAFALLYFFEIKVFLFYFFIIYLINSELKTDYIRKIIRIFQFWNEIKLMSILKKLWISDKEIKKISKETDDKLTIEQKKDLENDIRSLL